MPKTELVPKREINHWTPPWTAQTVTMPISDLTRPFIELPAFRPTSGAQPFSSQCPGAGEASRGLNDPRSASNLLIQECKNENYFQIILISN